MAEPHYHYAHPHGQPCTGDCDPVGSNLPRVLADGRCDGSTPCPTCHPPGGPLFLVWCLTCEPDPTPDNPTSLYPTAEARGRWCAAHTKGHEQLQGVKPRWRVIDLPAGRFFRVRVRHLGGHWHLSWWSAARRDGSYAELGKLTVDEHDWAALAPILAASPLINIITDPSPGDQETADG